MYNNLEKCINAVARFVTLKDVVDGKEQNYHVVRANQTMNPEYQQQDDNKFVILADSYLDIVNKYWQEIKNDPSYRITILHTQKVERNAQAH